MFDNFCGWCTGESLEISSSQEMSEPNGDGDGSPNHMIHDNDTDNDISAAMMLQADHLNNKDDNNSIEYNNDKLSSNANNNKLMKAKRSGGGGGGGNHHSDHHPHHLNNKMRKNKIGSERKEYALTAAIVVTSSIYGQLLVVICIALFIGQIVSPELPLYYFEAFYLYLYSLALLFLFYVYIYLLNDAPKLDTFHLRNYESKNHKISETDRSHASIFLRIGSIVFGLGVMIYNGLEFGAFFELPPDSPCYSVLLGVNPILQAAFVFSQMYFIFTYSRLMINKFKLIARLGLMHLVAANICVWIRTLGKETLHELKSNSTNLHFPSMEMAVERKWNQAANRNGSGLVGIGNNNNHTALNGQNMTILNSTYCQNDNVMGSILLNASPYLYPFIVEYSLIAAAFLYIMWASIGKKYPSTISLSSYEDSTPSSSTSPCHHVNVDDFSSSSRTSSFQNLSALYSCLGSSKGLFTGFLFLAISVTSLIIFFVLIHRPNYNLMASLLSDISHSIVLILSCLAILIGFYKMSFLKFQPGVRDTADGDLRSLLLRVAAFGLYVYSLFGIIASVIEFKTIQHLFVLITSVLTILQVSFQTLFISDVVCRKRVDNRQSGRQLITFLLINNLTLWIIYTFQMQKLESSPIQLRVFGFTTWSIILRITLPLSIFYRFHSAITFAECWKNSYKTSSSSH